MMKINSLLNPQDPEPGYASTRCDSDFSPSPAGTPQIIPRSHPSIHLMTKKDKLPKDAPIYIRGIPTGEVRYPAYEENYNEHLLAEVRKYQIFPLGQIGEHVRHIPYNSDKKDFYAKTGREGFHAFQYSFKMPGESKEHHAMWDYNIGLVRMTAWFKCLKYPKTTPARVLGLNPGLRDISFSITGGALSAQGYWLPFAAAKAVAATFCWNIRHLLVPMFGHDFLDMCIPPDKAHFGEFKIDPAIVHSCTREAHRWQRMRHVGPFNNGTSNNTSTPRSTPSNVLSPALSTTKSIPSPAWQTRVLRPRGPVTPETDSDYFTASEDAKQYRHSPSVSPTSQSWKTVNYNRTPQTRQASRLPLSPTPELSSFPETDAEAPQAAGSKRARGKADEEGATSAGSAQYQIPTLTYDTSARMALFDSRKAEIHQQKQDFNAAHVLMQLSGKRVRRSSF